MPTTGHARTLTLCHALRMLARAAYRVPCHAMPAPHSVQRGMLPHSPPVCHDCGLPCPSTPRVPAAAYRLRVRVRACPVCLSVRALSVPVPVRVPVRVRVTRVCACVCPCVRVHACA